VIRPVSFFLFYFMLAECMYRIEVMQLWKSEFVFCLPKKVYVS